MIHWPFSVNGGRFIWVRHEHPNGPLNKWNLFQTSVLPSNESRGYSKGIRQGQIRRFEAKSALSVTAQPSSFSRTSSALDVDFPC